MDQTPVFSPWIDDEDLASVNRALNLGWISGTSPIVQEFEEDISKLTERRFVAAVSNGSAALDLAFEALDIGPGDEVILPNFTIISCLSAVLRTGATPILVDVDPISWNMQLEDVEAAYSNHTKAVLVVHTYGLPSPIDKISDFCRKKNIYLVEDAAEAHGILVNGQPCGSFGDVSTFSFYANKHVTCGEGGAVCTNSETIYDRVTKMRNLAFGRVNRFEHEELGWNYRISGLAAALGISQLKKLARIIELKKTQGRIYSELLDKVGDRIQLPAHSANGSENNFWVYGILLPDENAKTETVKVLNTNGYETRPFFHPLSEQPVFKRRNELPRIPLENSIRLGKNGIYLPTGFHINETIQHKIINLIVGGLN